jgi:putative DNA primase/helicase
MSAPGLNVDDDAKGNLSDDPVVWGTHDEPRVIRWLWKGKIVRGGLQLLAGEPEQGKSTILCDLAARITVGADWPDGQAGEEPARVILMTKEDDYHSVWLPRFIVAGGDKRLLGHVPMERSFLIDTKKDLDCLQYHLTKHEPRVAATLIDPLDDFTSASLDSHKAKNVRTALMSIHVLATLYQSAVLAIKHLNKAGGEHLKTPLQRLEGSAAYGALPRNVLVVTPNHEGRTFFGPLKGSLIAKARQTAIEYDFETVPHPVDPDPESAISRLAWKEECDVKLKNLMNNPSEQIKPIRPAPELEKALAFLRAELEDGQPHPIGLVKDRAKEKGITGTTLDRARERLKIKSERGCYVLPGHPGGG